MKSNDPQGLKTALIIFSLAGGLSFLFFILLILREHISKIEIIFYGYVKLLFIFTVLSVGCLFLLKKFLHHNWEIFKISVFLPAAAISLLLSYTVIMTFPVVMERSFSVYILGSIYNSKKIREDDLEKIVLGYFHERRLIGKRIEEQIVTGSIALDRDGYISMTPRGRRIVMTNALIGRLFNLDMENILPTATSLIESDNEKKMDE
jgi:hypothetical protein